MNTQKTADSLQYLQYPRNIAMPDSTRNPRGCNAMQYLPLGGIAVLQRCGGSVHERAIFCTVVDDHLTNPNFRSFLRIRRNCA